MTAVDALKGLKIFLEREVASTIKLQREGSEPPEYVNPYVALISLPHKNFMPVNFQVPFILAGITDGEEDEHENALSIRILCAVYGGDIQFQDTANLPDEKGYLDLINLLERIKHKLIQEAVIESSLVVNKPVQYGIYDEQLLYPYWYGYLTFTGQIRTIERQMIEFL